MWGAEEEEDLYSPITFRKHFFKVKHILYCTMPWGLIGSAHCSPHRGYDFHYFLTHLTTEYISLVSLDNTLQESLLWNIIKIRNRCSNKFKALKEHMLENWGEELYFKKSKSESFYNNMTKVTCNRRHTGDVGITLIWE